MWIGALALAITAVVFLGTASQSFPAVPLTDGLTSWIVQGQSTEQVKELIEVESGVVTSELTVIRGAGALLTEESAEKLNQIEGVSVTPNYGVVGIQSVGDDVVPEAQTGGVHQTADYSELVGANQVWDQGITGDGVTVAILDTGIRRFKGVKKDTNKDERILGWKDVIRENWLTRKYGEIPAGARMNPKDPNGHGTHIAGIIANSEKGADDGNWMGIAPDVDLLPVRVLDLKGRLQKK